MILDSGFCVLRGIVELKKLAVFPGALIKKRYWLSFVRGLTINEHFEEKQVGECNSLKGTLDGVRYDLFGMKEPDYVMKLIAMFGGLVELPHQEEMRRTWTEQGQMKLTTFKYIKPFAHKFKYRHAADDRNKL